MLQITTLKGNNLNQKFKTLSLAYVIRKDQFLSKGASSEEMWGVRVLNFILFYLYVCMYVLWAAVPRLCLHALQIPYSGILVSC